MFRLRKLQGQAHEIKYHKFRLLLVLFSFVYEEKKKVEQKFIILCSHFCMLSSIIEEKSNSFFLN